MTCDECVRQLLAVSLAGDETRVEQDMGRAPAELHAHLENCGTCRTRYQRLLDAQSDLQRELARSTSAQSAQSIARSAIAKALVRRRMMRYGMPVLTIVFVVILFLLIKVIGPEAIRLTAPQPEAVTETYSLSCLSPQQAASLLRPYLPKPQNPRWQAEAFSVSPMSGGISAVAVTAPRSTLDRVPALLRRFEALPEAACRVRER